MTPLNRQQISRYLDIIVGKAKKDTEVVGVIVFGSFLQNNLFKDIDVVLVGRKGVSRKNLMKKRLEYMKNLPEIFDIQIYQLLPLAIQKEVLSGNVLYETSELYEIVYETLKDYESFRRYREDYIRGVLIEK
ncbi:MAG: nucleotidyltransferase domain-containing protein [Candidatus Heimdallarchaeaceae archaeon]